MKFSVCFIFIQLFLFVASLLQIIAMTFPRKCHLFTHLNVLPFEMIYVNFLKSHFIFNNCFQTNDWHYEARLKFLGFRNKISICFKDNQYVTNSIILLKIGPWNKLLKKFKCLTITIEESIKRLLLHLFV